MKYWVDLTAIGLDIAGKKMAVFEDTVIETIQIDGQKIPKQKYREPQWSVEQ